MKIVPDPIGSPDPFRRGQLDPGLFSELFYIYYRTRTSYLSITDVRGGGALSVKPEVVKRNI